jgi:hypothetical protein
MDRPGQVHAPWTERSTIAGYLRLDVCAPYMQNMS